MLQVNAVVGLKAAQDKFERNFRDVIALISGGPEELWGRMAAEITMHPELNSEVEECLKTWMSTPSEYKLVPYAALEAARYRLLAVLFTRLRDRDAFDFAVSGTPEALAQMDELDVVAGLRQPSPPPPPKSQQEILDGQVIADWATLSTEKFKKKMNNSVAYREAFERLSAENKLSSQVTTLHDGYADGRVGG